MAAKTSNDKYRDIFGDSDDDFFVALNTKQDIKNKNEPQMSVESKGIPIKGSNKGKDVTNDARENKIQKEYNSMHKSLVSSPNHTTMNSPPHLKTQHSTTSESSVNGTSIISLLSSQERLELSSWGLPETVVRAYARKGINTMFKWQAECLQFPSVIENGGNLVYSAPTSAGKTLVSEILMMKRVFECKKKAIIILPFVSLAREKMYGLKELLKNSHVRVGGFMGQHHPPGGFSRVDIAVCTIEKANSLINRLLEEKELDKLGVIVVDELHLLGDSSRGYLLELLLTKVRYMSQKNINVNVQIIGMSATLPNIDLLAKWLNAELYTTNFRPVPLTETIKVGNSIFNNEFELLRELKPLVKTENDSDQLVYLCLETIMNGHSVLVFCPTKMWCEKLADSVAKEFFRLGKPPLPKEKEFEDHNYSMVRTKLQGQLNGQKLSEVIEQLKKSPAGLDPALSRTIRFGVAYHHAGLIYDERDIIEGAFKDGALRVLIATSTLSAGVNLPARRVIVRCPFTFQNRLIDTLSYKQMIGRAGRKGIDTEGESILFCRDTEKAKVELLVKSDLEPVSSCLIQGNGETLCSSMKRAILEVIASGVAETPEQVEQYASCTLLSASMAHSSFDQNLTQESKNNTITSCIRFLEENEFIRLQPSTTTGLNLKSKENTKYLPTQLGLGCLASSLSPDEALTVFSELQKARKNFVLENELHIIYQVVPIYAAVGWPNLDFMNYLTIWESLPTDVKRVGELVGVEERFLVRAMRGTINTQIPTQARLMAIHQRFYTALALHDLVNEVKLSVVSRKYGANKGMLQSLQQAASTFAGMVTRFCSRLGWLNLELLIGQYQDRFQFGIQRELIDLCRLSTLNGQRARLLFNSGGMTTVSEVAHANPADLEILLRNAAPFESGKIIQLGDSEHDIKARNELRSFWVTGKKGITEAEAARLIVEEARDVLQKDLGIQINEWNKVSVESNALKIGSNERNGAIGDKSYDTNGRKLNVTGERAHLSYLAGIPNNIKKSRPTKLKDKSPLERAKEKIKLHGEKTGTGRIVKEKTKRKDVSRLRNNYNTHTASLVQSISSPNFSNINGTSTPVKNHERSFDTSAQIEEIFDVQRDDEMNVNDAVDLAHISPNESTKPSQSGHSCDRFEDFCSTKPSTELNPRIYNNAHDILRSIDSSINNRKNAYVEHHNKDKTLKRVSWDTMSTEDKNGKEVNYKELSPPKFAKVENAPKDEKTLQSKENYSMLVTESNEKIIVAPQSTDIFGDSFLPENLSDLSCLNSKNSKLRNSRSCPNTPNFDVCSEELLVDTDVSELDSVSLAAVQSHYEYERESTGNFSDTRLKHSTKPYNQPINDPGKNVDLISSNIGSSMYSSENEKNELGSTFANSKHHNSSQNTVECDIFKTPVHAASHGTSNIDLKPKPQRIDNEDIHTTTTSFTFSDSDTDAYVEGNQNLSTNCKNRDFEPCDKIKPEVDLHQFKILHVCQNEESFTEFEKSIGKTTIVGCSFACIQHMTEMCPNRKIGQRTTRRQIVKDHKITNNEKDFSKIEKNLVDPLVCHELGIKVVGIAVSYSNDTVFYISFLPDKGTLGDGLINDSIKKRLDLAKKVLDIGKCLNDNVENTKQRTLIALDIARFCKIAQLILGVILPSSCQLINIEEQQKYISSSSTSKLTKYPLSDPRVALWLLREREDEYTMDHLVYKYLYRVNEAQYRKSSVSVLEDVIDNLLGKKDDFKRTKGRRKHVPLGCRSRALNPSSSCTLNESIQFSVAEAFICRITKENIESDLERLKLSDIYHQVEMPALSVLVKSDLNGFGFSEEENEKLRSILGTKLKQLENVAYKLADRTFQLNSCSDVCQVLYQELKLPINGERQNEETKSGASKQSIRTRRFGLRSKVPMSSSKDVLSKLKNLHDLPAIIIDWRKINAALSNTVIQFARASRTHNFLKMKRVYPTSNMFTATGRMTMQDPSIQMVPRDFEVSLSSTTQSNKTGEVQENRPTNTDIANGTMLMTSFSSFIDEDQSKHDPPMSLSLRRAFVPSDGCLLISADYSQMEIRILAHLSRDRKLSSLLQSKDGDVFKAIAASWLNKSIDQISDDERQKSKQICYGILYGMGPKSLAEQLDGQNITEEEASLYMTSFKSAYPEVQTYIEEVISKCRKQGFVETIIGRRRYLPDITLPGHNSCGKYGGNEYARAAAERQAVNTTIQGSAADIIKKAMINIDVSLSRTFPTDRGMIQKNTESIECGAYLVLQLHDELIYEVASKDVVRVAKMIRIEMENAVQLTVPTPVKIKIGPSWGDLSTLKDIR